MPFADPEKRKEYLRQYYLANKEKKNEQAKQYGVNNKEKIKEVKKQYALNNKEKLKEAKKQYEMNNKEKLKEAKKQYYLENKEKLNEAKKQYYLENKEKLNEAKKQYYLENKEKLNEISRQYQRNNKEKLIETKKQYNLKNKEKISANRKQYRLNNKEKINEAIKCEHKRQKRYCKDCSIYSYLVNLQRRRINLFLKNKNIAKSQSTIEYLDCSPEYFKNYIQSKMIDGMTFDNIHIDHIKPVCKFKLENPDELLKCCHYTNLQPLLIDDNLAKGGKWSDDDDLFWNENIMYKEYLPLYLPKNI
jgi:hypothetical protein